MVGGGISGLSVAWPLSQAGVSLELWDAGTKAGGKIASTRDQGYLTEKSASLLLNFKPEINKLIRQAGLEQAKTKGRKQTNSRRYVIHNRQLHTLPLNPLALLLSPLWSWRTKLRLATEIVVPRGNYDGESAADFITRRLGREMLEKGIDPFIAGTLSSDAHQADASQCLPRLTELERRFGSITAGIIVHRILRRRKAAVSELFSFQGGMAELVNTLADEPGIQLRNGYTVCGIEPYQNGWQVTADSVYGDKSLRCRHLVLATPAPNTSALLTGLDSELSGLVRGIDYSSLAVVHMGLDQTEVQHPLDGTGFLTPKQAGLSFNGNLWMSSLFPNRAPQGKVLLTSYAGGYRKPELFDLDDEPLSQRLWSDLQPLLGLKGAPGYLRVDRHQQALPLYHGNYSARMAAVSNRLKKLQGLHLCANYRFGVSVRDRIYQGLSTAEAIVEAQRHATSYFHHQRAVAQVDIHV